MGEEQVLADERMAEPEAASIVNVSRGASHAASHDVP